MLSVCVIEMGGYAVCFHPSFFAHDLILPIFISHFNFSFHSLGVSPPFPSPITTTQKTHQRQKINYRKLRDELSHNLFLMLQECNKFREHQARELLIDTLELQLQRRTLGLETLKEKIRSADDALVRLQKFEEEGMETG